jgi:hypothetical protein
MRMICSRFSLFPHYQYLPTRGKRAHSRHGGGGICDILGQRRMIEGRQGGCLHGEAVVFRVSRMPDL